MRVKRLGFLFSVLVPVALLLSGPAAAIGDTNYALQQYIAIPGIPLSGDPAVLPPSNQPAPTSETQIEPTALSTDIVWADHNTRDVYLSDRLEAGVDVFNMDSDTYLGTFAQGQIAGAPSAADRNLSGPNGNATDDRGRIWADNGIGTNSMPCSSTCQSTVFVGTLNSSPTVIDTGGDERSDELGFDPRDNIMLVGNDAECTTRTSSCGTACVAANEPGPGVIDTTSCIFLSFISTSDLKVKKRLFLDGNNGTPCATGLEQPVYDEDRGVFYVTLDAPAGTGNAACVAASPGTGVFGEVDTIDPTTMTVTNRESLGALDANCTGANGLALDPDRQRLAVACTDGGLLIHPEHGGTWVLDSGPLTSVAGADEIWFNKGDHTFDYGHPAAPTTATGSTSLTQGLNIVSADSFTLLQTIPLLSTPPLTFVVGAKQESLALTTAPRCCNLAADAQTNKYFLPVPGYGMAVIFNANQGSGLHWTFGS